MSRQGKRSNGMVMGAMCDMSLLRRWSEKEIKDNTTRNRAIKVNFLRDCRKAIKDGDREKTIFYLIEIWPYDKKNKEYLKNLYNRLHKKG